MGNDSSSGKKNRFSTKKSGSAKPGELDGAAATASSSSKNAEAMANPPAEDEEDIPPPPPDTYIPENDPKATESPIGKEDEAILVNQLETSSTKKKVGLDDFVLLKTVGKGSFGKVIQVRKKDTGKIYAMKILKKEQVIKRKQFEHTMAERRILEDVDHPFIVSLRFAFQTTSKLYMVFDFFNGGELFHYLSKGGRFTEERSRFYAAEIALGLEHVHNCNIIYRDLKPENLLLDSDGHIRITDFGLSKENVTEDDVKSFCGTPEYLAPEVLKRQKYGKAVDWWSLGTLLYEMICGLPPFYDRNRERMYKKILGAELRFPSHMEPEARSICRGMLTRDPIERLGYRGAQEVKSHPFFASINFDNLYHLKIEPPFKPSVKDEEDTDNVDKSFTSIPAAVTPTPADGMLQDAINKDFENFTFVQGSGMKDTDDDFLEKKGKR